jgi:Holliday junction resolvase-like predicted endonuclease
MDFALKQNYFEQSLSTLIEQGLEADAASIDVIEAYLAGKPFSSNKQRIINKHQLFWSSSFLFDLSINVLNSEAFVLALARYFSVETVSNFSLLEVITYKAPETVRKSIKRSEIVLKAASSKWLEVKQLSERIPTQLADITNVCKAFQRAHKERLDMLSKYQNAINELSAFEILSYSSVYAFKYLLVKPDALDGTQISTNERFRAVQQIIEWKLKNSKPDSFQLTEMDIGQSLKIHQSPLIFPSNEDSAIPDSYLHHFEKLVQAQVELDGFLSRSVTPFCFDDECEYYLVGESLEMRKDSDSGSQTWLANGNKQHLIDGYWFTRGFQLFVTSGLDKVMLGSAENQEQNQIAYIKSLGATLQLSEIYGLSDTIQTDKGFSVDIQKALLSLELMIAFYSIDFISVFMKNLKKTSDWQQSLGMLAMSGFKGGPDVELRFPITWCEWKQKAKNIVGWTVSEEFPKGSINSAEAILDFWSLDFEEWSTQLKENSNAHIPELTERPILKIGNYCVQLPWMMANQATNINVINNVRRFANSRPELHSETSRIETNLGHQFKHKGFNVIESYLPERKEGFNPGEIDLICVLDNTLLVIEVKSTFRRSSKREVIRYKNSTLRKAGLQIQRKVEAVKHLLQTDSEFQALLSIKSPETSKIIGWIADTSLEYDHEYFNGYLKVSVEELYIALSDSVDLMMTRAEQVGLNKTDEPKGPTTLYPQGFNPLAFVNTIEESKVWANRDLTSHNYDIART